MKKLLDIFLKEKLYQVTVSDSSNELVTVYYCNAKSKKEACKEAFKGLQDEYGELRELNFKASKFKSEMLDMETYMRKMSDEELNDLNEGRVSRGLEPIDKNGKPIEHKA